MMRGVMLRTPRVEHRESGWGRYFQGRPRFLLFMGEFIITFAIEEKHEAG